MEHYRQTTEEILDSLSNIESSWRDEHSQKTIDLLEQVPVKASYGSEDINRAS